MSALAFVLDEAPVTGLVDAARRWAMHATMGDVVQLRPDPFPSRRAAVDPAIDPATVAIERAAAGDQAAFAIFYDEVAAVVYGTVLRVLRDPAMSEEVTQEVFVELWRQAPRFDSTKGSPRSWAATVAHRRAVDRVRSETASKARDTADARQVVRDYDEVADAVTTDLDRVRVREALALLSPTQREAVSLAYYGGHTYREVADRLGVPEGTVKTRIRDGLTKLRTHLGGMP